MNTLKSLEALTTISADTADYEAIKKFRVTDVTTNPSIILQAVTQTRYEELLKKAVEIGKQTGQTYQDKIENAMDMVLVLFGKEILKIIPGRVHIQIDPRLSFDKQACVRRALKIVRLFHDVGIAKERIMVKIPSTWEGIQAAKDLEQIHSVRCNLTTMFTLVQAVACAEAGVTCLAPFVGRIGQWHLEKTGKPFPLDEHPGVITLTNIYNYFKKFGYRTQVMGAYFLNVEEVEAVAGCGLVTVPLDLLEELSASTDVVPRKLSEEAAVKSPLRRMQVSESEFRWFLNQDEMATDLLSGTIRKFSNDSVRLENIVIEMLNCG